MKDVYSTLFYTSHSFIFPLSQYAAGGTLTDYVAARYRTSEERGGLFLTEDEARYFFRVSDQGMS